MFGREYLFGTIECTLLNSMFMKSTISPPSKMVPMSLENRTMNYVDDDEEVLMVDRPATYSVWTWGANNNFVCAVMRMIYFKILGHSSGDKTCPQKMMLANPNPGMMVDLSSLDRVSPSPARIVMGKYQASIISHDKQVYTTGLRSGNSDMDLRPQIVSGIQFPVVDMAATNEHSAGNIITFSF